MHEDDLTTPFRPSYAAHTDRGQVRPANEDAVYADMLQGPGEDQPVFYLLAVADGVGGHQRGEWASRQALRVLENEVRLRLQTQEPADALRLAFETTNELVWQD